MPKVVSGSDELMELLAPAGNWEAFLAAVNNGADAVYLGGQLYSARHSAANFDDESMQRAIDYAHLRGKKVYAAVNTLIDDQEFAAVLDYLYKIQQFGIDAVILQDIGLIRAVIEALPQLRIHASTQMTIHNSNGAAWLQNMGVKRIVMARELNLTEIAAIHGEVPQTELEVFGHGALCYCFSGQCLFSSMVGGRSGNRGKCAQPCRLPYNLLSGPEKVKVDLADHGNYLLSPADLCLIEYLPALKTAGVTSLKIEGRMKRPEYVAVVTRNYRRVLDQLETNPEFKPGPEKIKELLNIFNRNFSAGHVVPGNRQFLSARRPNNRGVQVGRVLDQNKDLVARIKLNDTVNIGDGLVVWVSQGSSPAFTLNEIIVDETSVNQAGVGQIIQVPLKSRVFTSDRVFKTHDEILLASAQESISPNYDRLPLEMEVVLKSGEPLKTIARDSQGRMAEAETVSQASQAEQQPLDQEKLQAKLGRLGNTPFVLSSLVMKGDADLIVPYSELNDARRRMVEELKSTILRQNHPPIQDPQIYIRAKNEYLTQFNPEARQIPARLSVAVSGVDDAVAALKHGADLVYLGMEGLGNHRRINQDDINLIKPYLAAGQIIPLLPRINKPGDSYDYHRQARQMSTTIMAAHWGDLRWGLENGCEVLTDTNLNIFNSYSYRYLTQIGVRSIGLTPELSISQLAKFTDLSRAELIIHGEIILMEADYCMLGSVLGGDQPKCIVPCLRNQYYIKDGKGYEFPVATDADCRFYVFNSRTLCMIEDLPKILALKPSTIRIEARRLHGDRLRTTVAIYRQAMDKIEDRLKPDLVKYRQLLEQADNSPATKGHYYRGVL